MNDITLQFKKKTLEGSVPLPSSKSVSNRYLIVKFLSGEDFDIENLSESDDTKLMEKLLRRIDRRENEDNETELDCHNAGAVMRFLTALLSFRAGTWVLTSSNERMKVRPIGPLVEALRNYGVEIEYLEEEGYPPLRIHGNPDLLESGSGIISVDAGQSSQFVSALMLTAPIFPHGLHIEMIGENKVSLPYVQMTAHLLRYCGLEVVLIDSNNLFIDGPLVISDRAWVESDWSAASYIYALLALSDGGRIELPSLFEDSWQGDRIICDWFEDLGVETEFLEDRVVITKRPGVEIDRSPKEYDFVHHPDLAQTMAVCCAALGIDTRLYGIFGLKYKETDRITALRNELERLGAKVELTESEGDNELHIHPSELHPENLTIQTYGDHRMALAFSILAMKYDKVTLQEKDVVAKSFPEYWSVLKKLGAKF